MSFFITLPSFLRPSFEGNTPSNFKVRLPNRLTLEGSGWKVGLASITLPNMNFLRQLEKAGIDDGDYLLEIANKIGKVGNPYKIKNNAVTFKDMKEHPHNYRSGVDFFFMTITQILEERRIFLLDPGYMVEPEEFVPFTYKPVGNDFELHMGKDGNEGATALSIKVDSRLAKIMQWTHYDQNDRLSGYLCAHLLPEFKNNERPAATELAGLYVYASVGKSTIVGDQVLDLLREVEYKPQRHQLDTVHFEPNITQYHDVLSSDMEILEVQIIESDNTPLPHSKTT